MKIRKDETLKNKADSSLDVMIERAKQTEGISNVKKKVEGAKYSFTYDFETVEAINIATDRKIDGKLQKLYSYENGILTHYNILPIENGITMNGITVEDAQNENLSEDKQTVLDMNKSMFDNFEYGYMVMSSSELETIDTNMEALKEATTKNRVFVTQPFSDFMMSELTESDNDFVTTVEVK